MLVGRESRSISGLGLRLHCAAPVLPKGCPPTMNGNSRTTTAILMLGALFFLFGFITTRDIGKSYQVAVLVKQASLAFPE